MYKHVHRRESGFNVGECVGAMLGTGVVGAPVGQVHVVGVLVTGVGVVGLAVADPVIVKAHQLSKTAGAARVT